MKRVIGDLKEEGGLKAETGYRPAAVDQAEILGFLDPSDVPGDLGKLGPYRVLEVLGSGGMGIVLKAFDPALNRPVAIKVLAPQLASAGPSRKRFAREARAAAAIRNEHVVAIHAVDEWKGLPYLVMEFIPGSSLQERVDRSAPLDLSSILRIGMQTAAGLAAAHAQGLVHRDIKPSNILLENGVERVKLTDFGLARAVDDASLTQSGVVAGTPLFMAPEQARCETIDHRADLFSLGAVLYAMCTGRSPFRASTTLGVLRRVCDDVPRPVREVNPEVPDELAAVINRLLAKEPQIRFQTAAEVAETLGQLLARRQQGLTGETDLVPALSSRAVVDVGPAKRHRPGRLLQVAAYSIVLLSGAFVLAETRGTTKVLDTIATLLRIKTPGGTLVLEVFDPKLSVQVDGQSVTIRGPGTQTITMNPGSHRVDTVDAQGSVSSEWITMSRGDKVLVRVGHEPVSPSRSQSEPSNGKKGRAVVETPFSPNQPPLRLEIPGAGGILAYAHYGRYLIVAGSTIGVFDTKGGSFGPRIDEGFRVTCLAVAADQTSQPGARAMRSGCGISGSSLSSASEGPPRPKVTIREHSNRTTCLAFSPDGRVLSSGNADHMVRLWDRNGRHLGISVSAMSRTSLVYGSPPTIRCWPSD